LRLVQFTGGDLSNSKILHRSRNSIHSDRRLDSGRKSILITREHGRY
jgi:hypothetical protein